MTKVHCKVWIEEEGRVLFGEGRMDLLQAVAESGSLAGAARTLAMSYRAAWGRLRASENRLGFPLVERSEEGRRAMRLSKQGERLLRKYQELEKEAERFAARAEKALGRGAGRPAGPLRHAA